MVPTSNDEGIGRIFAEGDTTPACLAKSGGLLTKKVIAENENTGVLSYSVRRFYALILITTFLFLFLSTDSVRAEDLTSDVLFLSHFDNNTKNERTGNEGTTSGIDFGVGKFNQGVKFDSPTDHLNYSSSGNIDRTQGTIEFWWIPSSLASSGDSYLFTYTSGIRELNNTIYIWRNFDFLEVDFYSATGLSYVSPDISSWNAGEAHHIAVTWDANNLIIYLDGSQAESLSESIHVPSVDKSNIFIGEDIWNPDVAPGFGVIDEFIIFNDVRSASEISSDYSRSTAFFQAETTTTTTTPAGQDTTAPSLTAITAQNLRQKTATISWDTDENSSSIVEYGQTSSYGKVLSQDSDSVTAHFVNLSGLSIGTTYHYRVKSRDAAGNLANSSDLTFTTLDKDTQPPKVRFNPIEPIYNTATLTITGTSTDNQSGVATLSYTLDGQNYIPLEVTGTFEIKLKLDDGNYRLRVKAVDLDGNSGLSEPVRFVIDTLPPSLAGSSFYLGPQKLFPNNSGTISVSTGSKLKMVVSAVGGPILVQVETNGEKYVLKRIVASNLWQGEIAFNNEGQFGLETLSKDGAGNEVVQQLSTINVSGKGVVTDTLGGVVEGAQVSPFIWIDNTSPFTTGEWKLWQADPYGQQNPQVADKRGTYYYLLPQGRYKLVVIKEGFRDFVSEPFTLEKITPINATIVLESKPSLNLFGNKHSLPWFLDIFAKKGEITIDSRALKEQAGELARGKKAVDFSLPSSLGGERNLTSYAGRKILITFWTTWDPSSVEQIAILDETEERKDVVLLPVALQESRGRVKSYLARGKYLIGSLIDENGDLLENYKIQALPQHYLIGKDGIIKEIKVGILSKEKIRELTD